MSSATPDVELQGSCRPARIGVCRRDVFQNNNFDDIFNVPPRRPTPSCWGFDTFEARVFGKREEGGGPGMEGILENIEAVRVWTDPEVISYSKYSGLRISEKTSADSS